MLYWSYPGRFHDPAQPVTFSKLSALPGPVHPFFFSTRPGLSHLNFLDRPHMTSPGCFGQAGADYRVHPEYPCTLYIYQAMPFEHRFFLWREALGRSPCLCCWWVCCLSPCADWLIAFASARRRSLAELSVIRYQFFFWSFPVFVK